MLNSLTTVKPDHEVGVVTVTVVSWNVAYATGTPGVELKDYVMKDCLLIPYSTKQNKPDLVHEMWFLFYIYL